MDNRLGYVPQFGHALAHLPIRQTHHLARGVLLIDPFADQLLDLLVFIVEIEGREQAAKMMEHPADERLLGVIERERVGQLAGMERDRQRLDRLRLEAFHVALVAEMLEDAQAVGHAKDRVDAQNDDRARNRANPTAAAAVERGIHRPQDAIGQREVPEGLLGNRTG